MIRSVVVIEPMGFGGLCHYTYNLCEALSARGLRVSLITARNYELAARPRRFQLHPILREWFTPDATGSDNRNSGNKAFRAVQALRGRWVSSRLMLTIVTIAIATRASIVHVQWPIGPHDWVYLGLLRALGKRVVYTAHDVLPHEHTPADKRRLEGLLRRVDRVILHSDENAKLFHDTFAHAPTSTLVPHGDYSAFASSSRPTREDARRNLCLPPDALVVLFFGTIRPYKGLADLIATFPRVRARVTAACLVIAGYPFEEFGRYERAIDAAGIGGYTSTHLGYHPFEDVTTFFRAADVVVLPYRSASQSGVAQLAFAFAVPVVATRVGGLPEVIEDGRTGLLVDAGDHAGMANAIVTLLSDPDRRRAIGTLAREIAASRYSWDRIAATTLDVYERADTCLATRALVE